MCIYKIYTYIHIAPVKEPCIHGVQVLGRASLDGGCRCRVRSSFCPRASHRASFRAYDQSYVGGYQNYGLLLGPLNTTCRGMSRTQRGTII